MDLNAILNALKGERDRLHRAIAILEGGSRNRRGRPPGATSGAVSGGTGRKRRRMSAAARKLISEAMKKRWAERKRQA